MNQISWLIYLANVLQNVGGVLVFFGIIVFIIAIAYFVYSLSIANQCSQYNQDDKDNIEFLNLARKTRRWCPALVTAAFVLWTAAAFCPSQETVLAIAASQVGEQVLKSPTATLAEQALNSWLKKQITPPPAAPTQ